MPPAMVCPSRECVELALHPGGPASAGALVWVASGSYFVVMRSVGLKVLKNRLSEYVRLASGGETVLVTDHDRVVAELSAPREGREVRLEDASLAQAVRDGWLTAPSVSRSTPPPQTLPVARLSELLAELADDRDDR